MLSKIKDLIHKNEDLSEDALRQDVAEVNQKDVEGVMDKEEKINKKLSKAGPLKKYLEMGKVMFDMLKDYRKGNYKEVPWFTVASIVMSLLYVFNPLDVIPDFLPGLGYIDDMTVFGMTLSWVESDIHKYLSWKSSISE